MRSRSQRSGKEREARSRTVKRVADEDLLRGALVQMYRTCGKSACRCQSGEKHPALYLSIKSGGKRSMVYIPSELEETVRNWVQNARHIDELLNLISEHCFQELLQQKTQTIGRKRQRTRRDSRKDPSP